MFTKPAIPGRVKTRLIGRLRAEQAAALHQAFLDDALARLSRGDFAKTVAWALEPGEAVPPAPTGWSSVRQVGEDLGARLYRALADAAGSSRFVAAVGSDHPELSATTVEEAFAALEAGADVAIGPAADGGYYLIAIARGSLVPALFEGMVWSTASVYAETRARTDALGLRVVELALGHDVDDAAGLDRLASRLASRAARRADGTTVSGVEKTRALLAEWGFLEAG